MADDDLLREAGALLAKIYIVTGWVVSTDPIERGVLIDQLSRKMRESYATCTHEEVMYAIRNYGTQVKDWGKQLNLSLLDEVMQPYFADRAELSLLEENIHKKISQNNAILEDKHELTDEDYREWLETAGNGLKNGYLTLALLPVSLYDWAAKNGCIALTDEEKKSKLLDAVNIRRRELEENMKNDPSISNRKELTDFNEMASKGEFRGAEAIKVKNLAKKCALFTYLKNNLK